MADSEPTLRTFLDRPVVVNVITSAVAGTLSRTAVSPLELMKIIYQVQDHTRTEYKMSMTRVIEKIWEEEKWKGYWRGNGVNCLFIVPYSVTCFSSYNFFENQVLFEFIQRLLYSLKRRLTGWYE
jgi:solute carrier family 25 phosphate transporter 23/24/25/41